MRNRTRLSPLTGLSGVREAEQLQGGAVPMRGGYNVSPVDGEWWSRPGRPTIKTNDSDPEVNAGVIAQLGNIQWNWILSSDSRDYIASPDYCLEINSEGRVNQAYTQSEIITDAAFKTELAWMFYGSAPGVPKVYAGDLIVTGDVGEYGQVYRCIYEEENAQDPSGNSRLAYLDRYWVDDGVWPSVVDTDGKDKWTATVRIIPSLQSTWGSSIVHRAPVQHDIQEGTPASACLFDQLVTFDSTDSNRDLKARRTYMIITSKQMETPVAILLDDSPDPQTAASFQTPRQDWFRNTAISFDGKDYDGNTVDDRVKYPYFCCVSNNRLIMGRCADDQGGFASRTIWYSGQNNLSVWHTGVQGETSGPNFITFDRDDLNDIRGLLPLGNRFVVHRRHSQMVASFTGSNAAPFQIAENDQDVGIEAYGAVVLAGGLHFFPTLAGPAAFDGQSVIPMAGDIRAHLVSMGFWYGEPFAVGHDRERKLVYFFTSHARHQDATEPTARTAYYSPGTLTEFYSSNPTLVFSTDRQSWFFEDQTSLGALGTVNEGSTWGMRLDGTLIDMATVPAQGLDGAVECTSQNPGVPITNVDLNNVQFPAEPVDCFVESAWLNFGSLERKMLTKLIIQIRAWPATDVWSSPSDVMHAATLEIMTNGDATTVRNASPLYIQHTVEQMTSLDLDENRQEPLMMFELSPRVSGETFKFRFKNALPAGSTAKKGPMRIANVEVFYDQGESNRPVTSIGRN